MSCKKIILGVTASVAIYRALELIRMLQKDSIDVEVVMTPDSRHFIRPLMFEALLGREIWCDPFSSRMPHIHLSRGADAIAVIPATMNFINKLAVGISDNLLLSLCQASKVPIILAPAMNPEMFANPATQENIERLKKRGVTMIMPEDGMALCGEAGPGRLAPYESILSTIYEVMHIQTKPSPWKDRHVLITAGPTRNYLDPIRFISNGSSGRMGVALAEWLQTCGAQVQLALSQYIPEPEGIQSVKKFASHDDLANMYRQFIGQHQEGVIFAAAAPSDFKVMNASPTKLPKKEMRSVQLEPLPDLLQTICSDRPKTMSLVGFCAESDDLEQKAEQKMKQKHCDFILANGPTAFGSDQNSGVILSAKDGRRLAFKAVSKTRLAQKLCDFILE